MVDLFIQIDFSISIAWNQTWVDALEIFNPPQSRTNNWIIVTISTKPIWNKLNYIVHPRVLQYPSTKGWLVSHHQSNNIKSKGEIIN